MKASRAALAALLAVTLYPLPSTLTPAFGEANVQCVVIAVKGAVTVARAGKKAESPAKKGDFLYEGDALRTAADSQAEVALTGGVIVRVNEKSEFKMAGSKAGQEQKAGMDFGQIWTRVLHGKANLTVKTPTAVAAVRGTEADISMRDVMTVKVYEGTVDVINAFGRSSLRQGQMSTVRGPEAAPEPPRAMAPDDAETWHQDIQGDAQGTEDLLEKLEQEAAQPPEKTLRLKIDKDGEQKELKIKFKKGE